MSTHDNGIAGMLRLLNRDDLTPEMLDAALPKDTLVGEVRAASLVAFTRANKITSLDDLTRAENVDDAVVRRIEAYSKTPAFAAFLDGLEDTDVALRLGRIEMDLGTLKAALALRFGSLIGVLPTITLGPGAGLPEHNALSGLRSATIEEEVENDCKVVVKTRVNYERVEGPTVSARDKDGTITRVCTTFKITITTRAGKECPEGSASQSIDERTSTHTFKKAFCGSLTDDIDVPTTGESTGFDGVKTDTVTFPHGTRVKVEKGKPAGQTTVTLTYPDGTTATTSFPNA